MKKSIFLALALSFLLMLSACGSSSNDTQSSNTPSGNNSDDTPSSVTPDSTPSESEDTPNSQSSVTDDFLKTITAETAEYKGICGPDLTWYYQDNVLVIKGTGEMNDYGTHSIYGKSYTTAPWGEEESKNLYSQWERIVIR